jgi:hypothetical protein
MYVHHEARMIYLAHPKTASGATSTALKSIGFIRPDGSPDHARMGDVGTPAGDWFVFTTVRNHWDALASWTVRRCQNSRGVPSTFTVRMLELVCRDADGGADKRPWHLIEPLRMWFHLPVDHVMRFETLRDDLSDVLKSRGLHVPHLHPENMTAERNGKSYREFYTPDTRDFVYDRFTDEIKQFRYSF